MRMFIATLAVVGLLALLGAAGAGDPPAPDAQALKAMAKLVRQDEAVLRWREIPWYSDANEGLKAARSEKRPILLWVSGDEPLGRC